MFPERDPVLYKRLDFKQQTVTTSAVTLTATTAQTDPNFTDNILSVDQIIIQAPSSNAVNVTVGNASVTAGGAGYDVPPGANLVLNTANSADWFAICASGSPKLNIIYCKGII